MIALVAVFGQLYGGPQPAQDFTVRISLLYWQIMGNESYPHAVIPPPIGVFPGIWATHQYDFDGLNNHYPLYTDPPASGNYSGSTDIHVRSRSTHAYTLRDFFNVWGEPVGVNDTLGYTVPPPSSQSNNFGSTWFWDMCVKPPGGVLGPPPKDWGSLVLLPGGMTILLYYSDVGCA